MKTKSQEQRDFIREYTPSRLVILLRQNMDMSSSCSKRENVSHTIENIDLIKELLQERDSTRNRSWQREVQWRVGNRERSPTTKLPDEALQQGRNAS
jgi:hypothetical protein